MVLRYEIFNGGDVLDGADDLLLRDDANDAGKTGIFETLRFFGKIVEDLLKMHSNFIAFSKFGLFQSILRQYPFPFALDGLSFKILSWFSDKNFTIISTYPFAHFIIYYNICYFAIRFFIHFRKHSHPFNLPSNIVFLLMTPPGLALWQKMQWANIS